MFVCFHEPPNYSESRLLCLHVVRLFFFSCRSAAIKTATAAVKLNERPQRCCCLWSTLSLVWRLEESATRNVKVTLHRQAAHCYVITAQAEFRACAVWLRARAFCLSLVWLHCGVLRLLAACFDCCCCRSRRRRQARRRASCAGSGKLRAQKRRCGCAPATVVRAVRPPRQPHQLRKYLLQVTCAHNSHLASKPRSSTAAVKHTQAFTCARARSLSLSPPSLAICIFACTMPLLKIHNITQHDHTKCVCVCPASPTA